MCVLPPHVIPNGPALGEPVVVYTSGWIRFDLLPGSIHGHHGLVQVRPRAAHPWLPEERQEAVFWFCHEVFLALQLC